MPLPVVVSELIADNAFAVLTTLFPDGRPHSHMMWVDADADCLLVNTETDRSSAGTCAPTHGARWWCSPRRTRTGSSTSRAAPSSS